VVNVPRLRIFVANVVPAFESEVFPPKFSLISVFWDGYHLSNTFYYLTLLPMLSVAVRRFHDIGLSGFRALGWLLLPVVGGFILGLTSSLSGNISMYVIILSFIAMVGIYIYWLTKKSEPSQNQFGADTATGIF